MTVANLDREIDLALMRGTPPTLLRLSVDMYKALSEERQSVYEPLPPVVGGTYRKIAIIRDDSAPWSIDLKHHRFSPPGHCLIRKAGRTIAAIPPEGDMIGQMIRIILGLHILGRAVRIVMGPHPRTRFVVGMRGVDRSLAHATKHHRDGWQTFMHVPLARTQEPGWWIEIE